MRVKSGITKLEFNVDIDWLKASKEERAGLYRVTRAVALASGQSIDVILDKAVGHTMLTGIDYQSNFRQGKIARPKAKLVYAWISKHHIDTAHTIAPEMFPMPVLNAWERYLDEYAIHGKFRLVRMDKSRGIVQRAGSLQPANQTLRLGEDFCFELESEQDQALHHGNYRTPLGRNGCGAGLPLFSTNFLMLERISNRA